MLLLEIAIAGGVLYTGARAYYRRATRPTLGALLADTPQHQPATQTPRPGSPKPLQHVQATSFAAMVASALTGFKPPALLQDAHRQQLTALTGEEFELSERERTAIHHVQVALAATAISGVAVLVHSPLIVFGGALLGYLYIPILQTAYRAFKEKKHRRLQLYEVLVFGGEIISGYYFAAALSTALYFLAEHALVKAEDQSRKSLSNVFGQQPRSVWALVDGVECELAFDAVQVGAILVVSAGEIIPVDGRITHGGASVDQHMLTGEAQPVEKSSGDGVLATTLVLSGKIYVEVQRAGSETTAAQIGTILSQTAQFKVQLERRGTALLERYIPLTLGLGAVSLPFLGPNGALEILESAYGYNLRLSSPFSLLNFLQIAAREGILIKDGAAIELLATIDTLVFDKTGTLTLEQPRVSFIHTYGDISADTVLTWAAAAEQRQTHPIARAIVQAACERGLTPSEIDDAHYQIGYGIKVNLDGHTLRVGSQRFMALEQVGLPATLCEIQTVCYDKGHSLVLIACDQVLVGAIELHPTIRPEAAAVVAHLKQRNLQIYILSGDHEQPTRHLARQLGIDTSFAEVLPQEKSSLVERLQQEGRKVCFVGDGINDAIALKQADLSVSLRGASTAPTDTAQVVLMDARLQGLVKLFDLGHEYHDVMGLNRLLATVPSVICIGGIFLLHWGLGPALLLYNLSLAGSMGNAYLPMLLHYLQGKDRQGAAPGD